MNVSSLVIIARSEHMPAFRRQLGPDSVVGLFADSDSLKALEEILNRPPKILALDPVFATTARGAALVARLKTEAHLTGIDLRLLIEDETKVPLLLAQPTTSPEQALLQTSRPLDRAGTRRAVRFPMSRRDVIVNGEHGQLIDLSVTGAQVLVPMRLQPSQPLRLALTDEPAEIRCQGTVAWSVAVPSGAAVHYRAGVELVDPDTPALTAFCARHGGSPDPTFGAAERVAD